MEELTHNKGHSRLHVYTSLLLTSVMVCMLGIKFELCSQAMKRFHSFPFSLSFHLPSISTYLYPSRPLFYPLSLSLQFTLHTSNSHSHCHSSYSHSLSPSYPQSHSFTLSPDPRLALSRPSFLLSRPPSFTLTLFCHPHSVLSPLLSFMPSLRPSLSSLYPAFTLSPSLHVGQASINLAFPVHLSKQFKNWSVSSVAIGIIQNLSEYHQQLANYDQDLPLKILQVKHPLYKTLLVPTSVVVLLNIRPCSLMLHNFQHLYQLHNIALGSRWTVIHVIYN